MVELLLLIISLLTNRLILNSKNSNKPPSTDPNRTKNIKPEGQQGHPGKTLKPVENPDAIKPLLVDRSKLPKDKYREVGSETRQVIDLKMTRWVTEYQAQILEDTSGKRYKAEFPDDVGHHVQCGKSLNSHAVYLSQYQLIP